MRYLIIKSHPYGGSFNAGAAEVIRETALAKGHAVHVIDLVGDGFNPVMTSADLKAWGQGQYADPLVETYQCQIDQSDVLVFPFPIWWGNMPAVLKGFCDKVLLPGWAYKYGEHGEMIGLLTGKRAIVMTTMETPLDVFESVYRNPVDGAFIKDTLATCGIEVSKVLQIDRIVSGGREHAEKRMKDVAALVE